MIENKGDRKTIRRILKDPTVSSARKYRALVMGDVGWLCLAGFELANLFFGSLPGAIGIYLRRKLFRFFFGACGNNLVIGRGCTFRHPGNMSIGDNVIVDDYCCLDARGTGEGGFVLGDGVVVNRLTEIRSKNGDIRIGDGVNIGSACQIISQSGIFIGSGASIAGGSGLRAGTYELAEMQSPMAERSASSKGPIEIGENVWLAARVTVLDAVRVGDGAVVAAGSVVNGNIPPGAIAHGNPATVIFAPR